MGESVEGCPCARARRKGLGHGRNQGSEGIDPSSGLRPERSSDYAALFLFRTKMGGLCFLRPHLSKLIDSWHRELQLVLWTSTPMVGLGPIS